MIVAKLEIELKLELFDHLSKEQLQECLNPLLSVILDIPGKGKVDPSVYMLGIAYNEYTHKCKLIKKK